MHMQKLLRPMFCLLIEDNPLVGLDLADALDAGGYYVACLSPAAEKHLNGWCGLPPMWLSLT